MTAANVLSYFAQVGLLIVICASLPHLLGLRSPSLQHAFWRTLLAVCLLLPVLEPRLPAEMVFVPAPVHPAAGGVGLASNAPDGTAAAPGFDWVRAASIVVAAGIAARLGWIAAGLLRLRKMRHRAVEPAVGFDDLQQTIGVAAPIRWSAEATHPVTFGVVRPIVVLPYAIKSVDVAAQRAVVAHELHHVKRRDWLWTILEEILRSAFWFHPAMWWLISRVQLARETVVDELSILTTNERRAYLDTLLAFADDRALRSLPAFSARRHLFHRVMLLSKEGTMSSTRIAVASCLLALALVGGTCEAVSAFPLHATAAQPQMPPPPPPDAPRQVSPEPLRLAKRISIRLTDADLPTVLRMFGPIADMEVAFDPALRGRVTIDVTDTPWDQVLAGILAPHGLAFVVKGHTLHVLPDQSRSMPPPPPPGGADMVFVPKPIEQAGDVSNPVRIGGDIKSPVKIRDVRPMYPPIARDAGVTGVVIVEVLIDSAGSVAEAHILRSIPLLDQAALDAVKQWRFMPVRVNGEPRSVFMTVPVNFTAQ